MPTPATFDSSTILDLDSRAFRAWPARVVAHQDGWRLRFTDGVTRRANSVWTSTAHGRHSVDARIAAAESFYQEHGAAACFQVAEFSQPEGLERALELRGYRVDAPVSIRSASSRDVSRHVPSDHSLSSTVGRVRTAEWLHVVVKRGRFRDDEEIFLGILDRIGPRGAYALVTDHGEPVAAGLGVTDPPWLGVFSMHTLTEHRRRGAGARVLRALAEFAIDARIDHLYLQVERDNAPALALYSRFGFVERYRYHYRTR